MFLTPGQTLRSRPLVNRFRLVLPIVFALVAATSIAACGGDSGNEGQPAPSGSSRAMPSGTTAATPSGTTEAPPLGGGELIVFERVVPGAEERDLYAVGPDGGEPSLLASPGGYPHWSPDGSTLAFSACLNPPGCTNGVALLERSTGDVHGFSTPDTALEMHCGFAWSPDGERLACEIYGVDDPKRNGVYTIRASDGKGLTRITSNPGGDDFPLAYSPDGSQLLLDRTDPARVEPANRALFVTPVSGGQPQRITPWGYADDYASWSPDGRTIVFGTNGLLYRTRPSGQGLDKITLKMPDGSSAINAFDVSFSPDGRRIVFSLGSPEPGLYTAHVDGSDVKQLTTSPTEDHHANWSAASGS